MTFAEVFIILLLGLAILVALPCWWMVCSILSPRLHIATTNHCTNALLLCALIGLLPITAGVYLLILVPDMTQSLMQIAAIGFVLICFIAAQFGLAGFANRLGNLSNAVSEQARLRHGSIILALSFVFPVIGWFAFFSFALMVGLGSFIWALFPQAQKE